MDLKALIDRVDRHTREKGVNNVCAPVRQVVPGLHLFRQDTPTSIDASIYNPIVCLILQGRKETTVGDRCFGVTAGECVIVSHVLPTMARITHASPTEPYLAVVFPLDLAELRSIDREIGASPTAEHAHAYAVSSVDDALLDVVSRYTALLDDPADIPVLAPLARRELHYRLLTATNGTMLRSLLKRDSHASCISLAIEHLRRHFRQSVEIPMLARDVGMSASSFHKHFKQITATTPLQFQKDLRLTEAKRLLLTGDYSVSTAAFEVGYESTTQFSREYSRKYGAPPSAHLRVFDAVASAEVA